MEERESLEINYKRHLSHSYMIVEEERGPEETYELIVLAYNRIPGLLTVETEIADGRIRFWYDITGRQTMSDYLERKLVDSHLLLLLFQSIERMCSELSNYLLWEAHVLLKLEYLYLDFSLEHLEFAYLPGWKKDIRDSFQELMEDLLRRLDHNDKQAAAMAYEMYQMSLQRDSSFFSMVRQSALAGRREWQEHKKEDLNTTEDVKQLPEEGEISKEGSVTGEQVKLTDALALKEKIMLWMDGRRKPGLGRIWDFSSRKRQEELPYVTQEEEPEEVHPTELLTIQKEIQGILLYQGEGNQKDIKIDKHVFMIGKQKNEVDGYIGTKSVSRVHARIEIEENDYYLEDLNSTNGTLLNGEALEFRQKVKLKTRDRISFGREEYIFM